MEGEKQTEDIKDDQKPFVSKYPKNKDNRFDLNEEKFSYVIFGTGLTESIIGASLAMHGKKCLHLDKADKYGGSICNFNLEGFLKFGKYIWLLLIFNYL